MYQLNASNQSNKEKEVRELLNKKDVVGLANWLKRNEDGGEVLCLLLDDLNLHLPENFDEHVLSRLP